MKFTNIFSSLRGDKVAAAIQQFIVIASPSPVLQIKLPIKRWLYCATQPLNEHGETLKLGRGAAIQTKKVLYWIAEPVSSHSVGIVRRLAGSLQ